VEKNGRQTIVMNGKPWKECEEVWEPIFSPDGSKVLVRSIESGKYFRSVISTSEIAV